MNFATLERPVARQDFIGDNPEREDVDAVIAGFAPQDFRSKNLGGSQGRVKVIDFGVARPKSMTFTRPWVVTKMFFAQKSWCTNRRV